jgi:Ca-activated chloride channel family protein
MSATDIAPDRVTRARYAIADLLNAAHGARVALVAFAGESHTVTPITTDVATVRALLQPLAPGIMPESGDQLAPALDEAARLLKAGGVAHGQVIVLTDGFADPAQALPAAQRLSQQGASVNVIGIGTASGAPLHDEQGAFVRDTSGRNVLTRLDPDLLQRVATAGNGSYVALTNTFQLIAKLQAEPTSLFNEPAAQQNTQVATWLNDGFWLLPFLLLFAALIARRGWL